MFIDETYKRRVRIEGKPDEFNGFNLYVHDIETGEAILNVSGAMIYLCPGELTCADLTYYKHAGNGGIAINEDGTKPIIGTVRTNDPEIAVSAYERLDNVKSLADLLPHPRHVYYRPVVRGREHETH